MIPSAEPRVYDQLHEHLSANYTQVPAFTQVAQAIGTYVSCGVTVLMNVVFASPEQIVHKIMKERHPKDNKTIREAFVIFSDKVRDDAEAAQYIGTGQRLADYIRANACGEIIEMGPRMNPNSGNMIKIWVWSPAHESLDPKHKYMPVFGKVRMPDMYGNLSIYEDDPRFNRAVKAL